MIRLRQASAACLLALVSACAAPSWQNVPQPDPNAPVPADACRVVLVREGKLIGRAREVRVYDSEVQIGSLGENDYLCWDRPAARGMGRLVFSGYELDGGPVENVFDLPREGGTTTWFAIRLRGEDRKPIVESVPPEEGRALVADRKPAEPR
jgi:hypothetical protein